MSLGEIPALGPENGAPSNGNNLGLTDPASAEEIRQVQEVLSSEIGVSAMLNRLKQSIASAKEFALFLKKRSILEDEHSQGLRKLCRMSQDNMHRNEHRGGSFANAYDEMMTIQERMAENGMQFSTSLYQMHDDLLELATMAEKSRKGWKQSGLVAEQRVAELEAAMRKSKTKYDSLAEEYERARTGDASAQKGAKMFGFKGPRSAAQHEEDLLRKVQGADQDYHGRVQTLQTERSELLSRTRPETVKALQDIVKECDSALVLQMQKFASFNEKLLLSNGLSISPLKTQTGEVRSLREVMAAIDNDKDLSEYVSAHFKQLPPRRGEPKYERNPILDQQHRAPISPQAVAQHHGQDAVQPPMQPGQPMNARLSQHGFPEPAAPPPGQAAMGHGYRPSSGSISMAPGAQRPGSQPQHERSFSLGSRANQPIAPSQQQFASRASVQQQPIPSSKFNGSLSSQGPPQLGTLSFQNPAPQQPQQQPQQPQQAPHFQSQQQQLQQQGGMGTNPLQQHPPSHGSQPRQQSPPQRAPPRPVFGLTLSRLYERDALAVPMVVYQCIQAVDLYGLGVEGIYRLSGSLPHVNKLKNMFDTDSSSSNLDFRNPENFFHDVNSVAGLLKQFFRDLPEPLLTSEHYAGFIEAAKNDDEIVRRDSLHAIINSLPDPNYATLRALTLHLHRVIDNADVTRMSSQNLAIVFGPTLMGTAPGASISDASWQVRVVDTILQNTYQIFDDD
ncbi:hypothetical protein QBC33DRAFT_242428 [Phialemonium atrogriseum]|uniref:Rho-GAP domain-containing protein n=1 Tax=Phialemonium atrogriseum TaxID=1093897 RepID=A0AAJ0FDT7_9PEZI|nr:uncharacterized protein QBC33DRAFT_242428 [Phialemonium atrogriseum]KAK1763602.1 hypothetical protein QBC33DRAFT_242428 [Phialemonium atrogriseum]